MLPRQFRGGYTVLQQLALTDNGYALVDGDFLLPEIWGLDNTGDQAFYHRGYVYPEHAGVVVGEEPGKYIVVET